MRRAEIHRTTTETDIHVVLAFPDDGQPPPPAATIATGVPFLDHMLTSGSFHGGFELSVTATGDTDVDDHHTVEDVGIVIGQALSQIVVEGGPVRRFGHAVIPMDDALAEVAIDAAGRPYLAYEVEYPQPYAGRFDLSLVREFMSGLVAHARINLHARSRAGHNGHHLAEAVFKACGRAIGQAYQPASGVRSTKGAL